MSTETIPADDVPQTAHSNLHSEHGRRRGEHPAATFTPVGPRLVLLEPHDMPHCAVFLGGNHPSGSAEVR
ncbi:hypothetical protein ABZX30_14315 [Streptomyces sp. NPDC004542]|uniref:hypothetical protein n=1 Tax=Streptomyces sp. NPDC004542 TaxID=3154281 RepID=UPI0033B4796F